MTPYLGLYLLLAFINTQAFIPNRTSLTYEALIFSAIKYTILPTFSNHGIVNHNATFVLRRMRLNIPRFILYTSRFLYFGQILYPGRLAINLLRRALGDYAAYQRTPLIFHAEETGYLPRSMRSILGLLIFADKLCYFCPIIPAYLHPPATLRLHRPHTCWVSIHLLQGGDYLLYASTISIEPLVFQPPTSFSPIDQRQPAYH